jgi:hypothetical protein
VVTRLAGRLVAVLASFMLVTAAIAQAQEVRASVVLGTPPALALDVRYQDPVALFSRLRGTLVFPVWVDARNVSPSETTLSVDELRVTIGSTTGSTAELRPISASDAQRRFKDDAQMSDVLKWITRTASDWAPNPFDRPLTTGSIKPSKSRSGFVFFLRPAGFEFDGFMTVAAATHAPELLPTAHIRTTRGTPPQPGLVERFVSAVSKLPGGSIVPALLYGRPFGKSYALLFGVSKYDDADKDLPGVAKDVSRMASYLEAAGFDRVVVLSDRTVTESALRHIEAHFNDKLQTDDRLLVYYAGHGQQSEAGDADLVLSSGSRVPMTNFMAWLRAVKVKHLLVLLDACYSGSVITSVREVLTPLDQHTRDKVYALANEGSRYVITAGDANQVAHEDLTKWGGGLFTTAVLRALQPSSKGVAIITTYDLYSRVKDYVVEEVQKNGLTAQIPRIRDLGYGRDPRKAPELSRGEFVFIARS